MSHLNLQTKKQYSLSQIVEQFWRPLNKMTFLRSLSEQNFRFMLFLKQKYHNWKQKQQLIKKGYSFISINEFDTLRKTFNPDKSFQWIIPNVNQLVSNDVLATVQRKQRNTRNRKRKLNNEGQNDSLMNKTKKQRMNSKQ